MKIEAYRFGLIQIDGTGYRNDVKLLLNSVVPDWWRSKGHVIDADDVKDLLSAGAEVCVIGTGASGNARVTNELKSQFKSRGVELVIEETEQACGTYNRLFNAGKKVVAGFHLTC